MRRLVSILLLAAVLACALPVRAGQMTVAFSSLPPWKMTIQGQPLGADVDLIRAVAREMGLEPVFVRGTLEECLAMLRRGQAEVMTSLLKTPDRERYLIYLDPPLRENEDKAFYQRAGDRPIGAYSDLTGRRIGVKTDAVYFQPFDSDPAITRLATPNITDLISMLNDKTIEAFALTAAEGDYWLRVLGWEGEIKKAPYVYQGLNPAYLAIARRSPLASRAAEMSAILEKLKSSGAMARITARYVR